MRDNYGYFEEDQLGKFTDLSLWRRIVFLGRPYWLGALLAVLLSLVVVGCGLSLPYLIRLAVDDFILNTGPAPATRLAGLKHLALAFCALMVFEFLGNFVQVLILEWTGQRIMHRTRQMMFVHLLRLDLKFFHRNPAGRLVTRLTNDIQNMHEMFTSVIVTLFNDGIKLLGILGVLFWMNWHLALAICLLLPLMVGNTLWFSRLARDAFRQIRTHLAKINSFLQESLSGVALIQLFRREESSQGQFSQLNQVFFAKALYQIRVFAVFMPLTELMSALSIGTILWYGGSQVMGGKMTIGMLVAFLSYMRLFFQPMRELSQKYSIVQSALASAERIFQLLDSRETLPLAAKPLRPASGKGEIEFKEVRFGYEPEHPVLDRFSLKIPPGQTLAIVGATGSGKTTIISLLERFYDPDAGEILLDGVDLRDLDPNWLRSQVGLVMQDVLIMPGTIRENILLDGEKSDAALWQILEKAQLARFVRQLPEGLATRVGEGGADFSAGQRQLLAFARILAREPRILVLDEATASVDPESEMLTERAIEATFAGRTNIVIAHRLSTIRRADHILVMAGGKIIEQGSHAELAVANGPYRRLLTIFSAGSGARTENGV
ncbi:ABC transporter ATP-binding protein [Thiovibrio frasassiensis]|uniref:ABC transporter ATP-binding protein/permease n=1 Tax=Thiovibrio frasassiensis TaxID=2984131 RepID=A0A9X4RKI7_9BACT|nr:ABC transporter ATP-binding protein [Thiovibrio frasassiensis]MDG4475071.1 ABC transporter ATP-binding protein/permease [Thiovibrio frasassiensis]